MDFMAGFGTALAIAGAGLFLAGASVVGIVWWLVS